MQRMSYEKYLVICGEIFFILPKMSYFCKVKHLVMTYFNKFHQESAERCLKKVAQSKSLQIDCEKEARKAQEMHRRIAVLYPKS